MKGSQQRFQAYEEGVEQGELSTQPEAEETQPRGSARK